MHPDQRLIELGITYNTTAKTNVKNVSCFRKKNSGNWTNISIEVEILHYKPNT